MSNFNDDSSLVEKEALKKIDYKIVTFKLGGRDYGIDIMDIREIQKGNRFTYIPNSPSYVRGVYNLRGEIISVVDLRKFFSLQQEAEDIEEQSLLQSKGENKQNFDTVEELLISSAPSEKKISNQTMPRNNHRAITKSYDTVIKSDDILIIKVGLNTIGVIVDSIEKVVGVDSSTIQEAHPLFADINISYIYGMVEQNNRLYIILDIHSIFGEEELIINDNNPTTSKEETIQIESQSQLEGDARHNYTLAPVLVNKDLSPPIQVDSKAINIITLESALLSQFNFVKSAINEQWFSNRVEEYENEQVTIDIRKTNEIEEFLDTLYSRYTGQLWDEDLIQELLAIVHPKESSILHVWDIGCAKGHEAYSLSLILQQRSSEQKVKIYAHDKDFLTVSQAPSLSFEINDVPLRFQPYITESGQFNNSIKNTIMFEYHDITNNHKFLTLDLVVMRDILSFVDSDAREKIFLQLDSILKPGVIIILGDHELVVHDGWRKIETTTLSAYEKI